MPRRIRLGVDDMQQRDGLAIPLFFPVHAIPLRTMICACARRKGIALRMCHCLVPHTRGRTVSSPQIFNLE